MKKFQKVIQSFLGRAGSLIGVGSCGSTATPWLSANTWMQELASMELPPIRGHIGVFALRNHTWIEWAGYAACCMRMLGLAPVFFYSSQDTKRLYGGGPATLGPLHWANHGGLWDTLRRIPDSEFVDLDAMPDPTQAELKRYAEFAADYAHTSAAYDLRVEELEGGADELVYQQKVTEFEHRLADFGVRVDAALKKAEGFGRLSRVLVYSGLIDVTAAAGEAGRRAGLDVMFVEGWAVKSGHMICSLNQPALVYDIESWLHALGAWDESRDMEIDKFLEFQENPELTEKDWLDNYHTFQRSKSTDELPSDVRRFIECDDLKLLLLAPNVVGDSATLRSRTIFRSQADWIQQVCSFVRGRSDVKLLVRAHPDEHFLKEKVVVKMGEVAARAAGDASNIRVVHGNEDVSTYALISYATIGLNWLSTVGADMVVRGTPVLAAALPKYHGLGIVHEPESISEYFRQLERMIADPRAPTAEQTQMARRYLTIIAREFSYEAFSRNYRATGIRLSGHDSCEDLSTFYRILAGDLPPATRPEVRGNRVSL